MMYATGKAMWANVSSPNTRFSPHKYMITLLTDEDTAMELEGAGLTQSRDRAGNPKYDQPAFSFIYNIILIIIISINYYY